MDVIHLQKDSEDTKGISFMYKRQPLENNIMPQQYKNHINKIFKSELCIMNENLTSTIQNFQ